MTRCFRAGWLCGELMGGWLSLLLAIGCGGGLTPPSEARRASGSEPADEGDAPADEPAEVGDASGDVFAVPLPEATTSEAPTAFDFGVWCDEREITVGHLNVERCEPARLGKNPDDVLWCYRGEAIEPAGVLLVRVLFTARGKKLVQLVELPYVAGSPNMAAIDDEENRFIALSLKVADDAQSFELRDDLGVTCEQAREANREAQPYDVAARDRVDKLIQRVCKSRGRYDAAGRRRR